MDTSIIPPMIIALTLLFVFITTVLKIRDENKSKKLEKDVKKASEYKLKGVVVADDRLPTYNNIYGDTYKVMTPEVHFVTWIGNNWLKHV